MNHSQRPDYRGSALASAAALLRCSRVGTDYTRHSLRNRFDGTGAGARAASAIANGRSLPSPRECRLERGDRARRLAGTGLHDIHSHGDGTLTRSARGLVIRHGITTYGWRRRQLRATVQLRNRSPRCSIHSRAHQVRTPPHGRLGTIRGAVIGDLTAQRRRMSCPNDNDGRECARHGAVRNVSGLEYTPGACVAR